MVMRGCTSAAQSGSPRTPHLRVQFPARFLGLHGPGCIGASAGSGLSESTLHWKRLRRRRADRKARLRPGPPGWKPSRSCTMRADQASSWYRRMSVVYAVGAWTMLGSLFYLGRKKSKPPGTTLRQPSVGRPDGVIEAASLCRKHRVYSAKPVGAIVESSSL